MDAEAFVAHIKVRHPEIASEIDLLDPETNTTVAAGSLARLTQRAVDAGDRSTVVACFDTALEAWDLGNDAVQSSVGISYLGIVNFADGRVDRAWAWTLLHPRLQQAAQSVVVPPPG